ncbi:Ger(x)C family spore germination protein [Paenisporosarcina indica]|uniref:Ger(x)C family spore germination protein n=1 Tax=Paenisporosarcina indica TaxID=650093 RepID=UPI000A97DD4A|nr:Ger(x)C family spore germination protein [Paenisporosarcina indica]
MESDETQPALEELAMIGVIAFDYIDEKKMKMTVIAPQPSPDAKEHTQSYTIEATLITEGLVQISAKADRMASLSQLRVVLFSEEFAKKGKMIEIVHYLYRDADVRETVRLGIVKDNAGDVLTADYPDKPNTNVYLTNLFEPKLYTTFSPFTDLHIFIAKSTDPTISPTVPYLEVTEGQPEISKIALFDGNHMVDTLEQDDGKLTQALSGMKKIAPFNFNLSEEEVVALEFIKADVKYKSNNNFDSPKITIKLNLESALDEYKGPIKITSSKDLRKLEKSVEERLEMKIAELIAKFKKDKVDPIGLLETLRMKHQGKWTNELTEQLLEKAKFDVVVNIEIVNIGAVK